MALGVLQAMTIAGIRVPEDVAIVGYDDISYAAGAAVPLSSVRQPREEMGRSAVRLLLEEIADQDTHRHRAVVFTPELIVRASSDHHRHEGPST
jgi:LacI family transcriptional regulator